MARYLSIFILVFAIMAPGGCSFSFHSGQYQFVSSMVKNLTNVKDLKSPSSDWILHWSANEIELLPVEVGKNIWFVGQEDVVVKFDGWQVYGVEHVLRANTYIDIEVVESRLTILENDRQVLSLECSEWAQNRKTRRLEEGSVFLTQTCKGYDFNFQNSILLNENKAIVEMVFFVHPNYPPIKLTRRAA